MSPHLPKLKPLNKSDHVLFFFLVPLSPGSPITSRLSWIGCLLPTLQRPARCVCGLTMIGTGRSSVETRQHGPSILYYGMSVKEWIGTLNRESKHQIDRSSPKKKISNINRFIATVLFFSLFIYAFFGIRCLVYRHFHLKSSFGFLHRSDLFFPFYKSLYTIPHPCTHSILGQKGCDSTARTAAIPHGAFFLLKYFCRRLTFCPACSCKPPPRMDFFYLGELVQNIFPLLVL